MIQIILLVLSIILVSIAGYMDVTDKQITFFGLKPTKEHLWKDGLYLLVIMIVLKIVFNISYKK